MTTAAIGTIGEKQDLLIRQGADFSVTVTLENANATPMDLTGATVRAHMRKRADGALVKSFNVVVTDADNGEFTFGLSNAETALLTCGESLTEAASRYVWDMELQDSLGRVTPLFYGVVSVFREVSHG